MNLEGFISKFNENLFFREFSFSKNKFSPPQKSELELADHVIWLDDLLITFQLKERNLSGTHTPQTETTWFQKKVLKAATKQIRDTLEFLNTYKEINIRNERGHAFNVAGADLKKKIHVVLYSPHALLPEENRRKKHHLSSTAGFIHIMTADDYAGVCRMLITPAEISEYLEFRKDIIDKWEKEAITLPEQALVGQFLYGDLSAKPDADFIRYLAVVNQTRSEFDFSHILKIFAERITSSNNPYEYYRILAEFAKLNRNELREVKLRFNLCIEKSKKSEYELPYRVTFPRTGCGFVFITVPPDYGSKVSVMLQNFTYAHKYDQKSKRCVGTAIARDGKYFDIGWCFMEEEWRYDPEMEQQLKGNFPFRKVEKALRPRYRFNESQ